MRSPAHCAFARRSMKLCASSIGALLFFWGGPVNGEAQAADHASATQAAPTASTSPTTSATLARSFLLVHDGQVVRSHEPTLQLPPASLAKLLTALVVVADARWSAHRWLPVSRAASAQAPTRVGLRDGEQVTAGAALAAMLIRSANDACRVLVDSVSSDVPTFAARMNARAKQLGMASSHFIDPCGFDADGQHSTVNDLLKLAQAARKEPLIAQLTALPKAQLVTRGGRSISFTNTNQLIGRLAGTAGMKTGYTAKAGQCLIAYVQRADHEVWLVMLGGSERWWQAHGMIENAFHATGPR